MLNWESYYQYPHSFDKWECRDAWLTQHGDRGLSDVFVDEEGEYVLMGGRNGREVKIYLPLYK